MKLPEIFPPADLLKKIEGIEKGLRQGKRLGAAGWLGFLIALALHITVLVLNSGWIAQVNDLPWFQQLRPWVKGMSVFFLVLSLVVIVWHRFWLQESQAPFRYTFWIDSFEPVTFTPKDERLSWLRHDLSELLSQRIRRLALLEDKDVKEPKPDETVDEGGIGASTKSHIYIGGYYVIRRDKRDKPIQWIIQVTPQIRIGPKGNPETLAHPVNFYLKPCKGTETEYQPLNRETYDRLLERVYFSVATEIYNQLHHDVQHKIELLPNNYYRAIAYFHEAEDYARSNTLNAYEQARELYDTAMKLFDPSLKPRPRTAWQRLLRFVPRTWARLRRPSLRGDAYLWPRWGKAALMLAKAETGYANMLLYRRVLAGLSGQRLNPIYESRPIAERAVKHLQSLSPDVLGQDESLFDAYVALGLAWYHLLSLEYVEANLKKAKLLDPNRAEQDPRYLYVAGLAEPRQLERLSLFRRAVELDPEFEVAQFQLAEASESLWRTRPTLEVEVANGIFKEYERVLTLNPGNVSAWANLGYMKWLLSSNNDEARFYFLNGRDYKEIVGKTYVAELDYGLARIAAEEENFDDAYKYFESALSAYFAQGIKHSSLGQSFSAYYFDFMGEAMMQRMEHYKQKVHDKWSALKRENAPQPTPRVRDAVYAFVLNDYGEACTNYYLHSGDGRYNSKAEEAYKDAVDLNEVSGNQELNVMPDYNLYRAFSQAKKEPVELAGKAGGGASRRTPFSQAKKEPVELAKRIHDLAPNWPDGMLLLLNAYVDRALEASQEAIKLRSYKDDRSKAIREKLHELAEKKQRAREFPKRLEDRSEPATSPFSGANLSPMGKIENDKLEEADKLDQKMKKLGGEIGSLKKEVRNLEQEASQLDKNATDFARKAAGLTLNCLPDWLFCTDLSLPPAGQPVPPLREQDRHHEEASALEREFNWNVLEHGEFRRNLKWEKEFDDLQVRALFTWSKYLLQKKTLLKEPTVQAPTTGRVQRLRLALARLKSFLVRGKLPRDAGHEGRRLLRYLEEHFFPSDYFDALLVYRDLLSPADYEAQKGSKLRHIIRYWIQLRPAAYWSWTWVDEKNFSDDEERIGILPRTSQPASWTSHSYKWLGDQLLGLDLKKLAREQYLEAASAPRFQLEPLVGKLLDSFPEIKKDDSLAVNAYRQATNTTDVRLLVQLARMFETLTLWEDCLICYQRAMEQDQHESSPVNPEDYYRFRIGRVLCALQRHEEAVREVNHIESRADFIRQVTAHIKGREAYGTWKRWLEGQMQAPADPNALRDAQAAFLQLVREKRSGTAPAASGPPAAESSADLLPVVTPIALEADDRLFPNIDNSPQDRMLKVDLPEMRERIRKSTGVRVPGVRIRANEGALGEGGYVLSLHEVPLATGMVFPNERYCPDAESCRSAGAGGRVCHDPVSDREGMWLAESLWKLAEQHRLELLDPHQYMVRHLESLIRRHLASFLGLQEVHNTLEEWARFSGELGGAELLSETLPDEATWIQFVQVVQALVREQVPIMNLGVILQAFASARRSRCAVEEILERVRLALRPSLPGNEAGRQWLDLSDDFEQAIARDSVGGEGKRFLALPAARKEAMLKAVRERITGPHADRLALVVRDPALRPFVRRLVEAEFPASPVLAERELMEEFIPVQEPVNYFRPDTGLASDGGTSHA